MRRAPRRRGRGRLYRFATTVTIGALLLLCTGLAWAWSTTSNNVSNVIGAAALGAPSTPVPVQLTGNAVRCTSIQVDWTAASGADAYRVEVTEDGGLNWTTLDPSLAALTIVDANVHRNVTAKYRVTPLLTGTNWEGPYAEGSIDCGVGTLEDLQVVQGPCGGFQISWTEPAGTDAVDIQRSIDGGGWSIVTGGNNYAGGSPFAVSDAFTVGDDITFRVRPIIGGTNGAYIEATPIIDWSPPFVVQSVVLDGPGGSDGELDAGDTVTVTFGAPVDTATATMTTIRVRSNGGARGLYLAADASNAGSTEIGYVSNVGNLFSGNANYPGTVLWSGGDTVWTWTSSGSGPTMAGEITGDWNLGTAAGAATCAATGAGLALNTPTLSGQW